MSQTPQFPVSDPYLASPEGGMFPIVNDLTVHPQYGNIKFTTPIGRFMQLNIMKPSGVKQKDGTTSPPKFSAQLGLNPNNCVDLYRAIVAVATHRFPPESRGDPANPSVKRSMNAEEMLFIPEEHGGLHYPLREGADNYRRDPVKYEAWRELYFINTSQSPTDGQGNPTRPLCYDENSQLCDPTKLYRGCYGLMNVTIASYPKPGVKGLSRGVTIYLESLRFINHGTRLGGYDPARTASEAFARNAIPRPPALQPEIGYGSHAASAGSVPPGVGVPGFAAPPPPQQQPAYQPQQLVYQPAPQQGLPPQQPQSGYAPAGARPPGG